MFCCRNKHHPQYQLPNGLKNECYGFSCSSANLLPTGSATQKLSYVVKIKFILLHKRANNDFFLHSASEIKNAKLRHVQTTGPGEFILVSQSDSEPLSQYVLVGLKVFLDRLSLSSWSVPERPKLLGYTGFIS